MWRLPSCSSSSTRRTRCSTVASLRVDLRRRLAQLARRLGELAALGGQLAQLLERLEDRAVGRRHGLGAFLRRVVVGFLVLQIALAQLTGFDAVGQLEQVADEERMAEDVLADLLLALLDLLGDFDFLLPAEQGDGADLLQVHADGIGGVLREVVALLAFLLGPLAVLLRNLLAQPRLGQRLDALDVDLAQHGDDAVDLLVPRLGLPEPLAHFVERSRVRLAVVRQLARLGVGTGSLHRPHLLRALRRSHGGPPLDAGGAAGAPCVRTLSSARGRVKVKGTECTLRADQARGHPGG